MPIASRRSSIILTATPATRPQKSASRRPAGLQKQIEALQKQMDTPTGNPNTLDKLKKDLEKLQEAAKGMASKTSPGNEARGSSLPSTLHSSSRPAA